MHWYTLTNLFFRYIITSVKPSTETIAYCLDILIRLLRDSDYVATKVFECEGLLESIAKYFVSTYTNKSGESSKTSLQILIGNALLFLTFDM